MNSLKSRQTVIAVVGLGYVGLPTAAWIANRKFRVLGVDVDKRVVDSLSRGECHIRESKLDSIVASVVSKKKLTATVDLQQAVDESQVVMLCIQTPLVDGKPDMEFLNRATGEVADFMKVGGSPKLLLIESSVPPGTTETINGMFSRRGFLLGRDYWLAHSPERVAPGKTVIELQTNPRIVGGADEESGKVAQEFVREAYGVPCLRTNARSAELAKLVENVHRDVGIAFANELALVCEQLQVDMAELTALVNSHPRVKILTPGVGVGGPCLPKDTHLLMHSLRAWSLAYSNLMRIAREINEKMPEHLLRITLKALAESGLEGGAAVISVLGITYKGDTDDCRFSPVKPIIETLLSMGFNVRIYDPMTRETFGANSSSSIRGMRQGRRLHYGVDGPFNIQVDGPLPSRQAVETQRNTCGRSADLRQIENQRIWVTAGWTWQTSVSE